MPLTYTKAFELAGEHSEEVLSVAISPKGAFIATAGREGNVNVWRSDNGKLVYCIQSNTAVHCVYWLAEREDQLLCGLQDGSVTFVTTGNVRCSTSQKLQLLTEILVE